MKNIKSLVFAMILIISLCSCGSTKKDNTETSSVSSDYRNIECDKYENYEYEYFSDKKDSNILRINVPKKWNFEKTEQGYNIVEFSEIIGNIIICDKFSPESNFEFVTGNEIDAVDVFVTHNIYKIVEGDETSYRHIFIYEYEDLDSSKNLVINMPYKKVSIDTASKMMNYTQIEEVYRDNYLGIMRIKDNRKKVLILGNSFISSSSIGQTLQEMCGSSITVDAYSKGYAQVYTYTNIPDIMSRIKNAEYSAVFMCGFYSTDNVDAFKTIVDSCVASKTMLAIFPAHNENRNTIDKAASTYSYPVLIDWKEEINMLYKTGIDYYDFCIDDAHKHSTDLAGFVGAHMIYRAIFGKIPNPQYTYSQVLSSDIDKLGSYVYTGNISPISQDRINYFE